MIVKSALQRSVALLHHLPHGFIIPAEVSRRPHLIHETHARAHTHLWHPSQCRTIEHWHGNFESTPHIYSADFIRETAANHADISRARWGWKEQLGEWKLLTMYRKRGGELSRWKYTSLRIPFRHVYFLYFYQNVAAVTFISNQHQLKNLEMGWKDDDWYWIVFNYN